MSITFTRSGVLISKNFNLLKNFKSKKNNLQLSQFYSIQGGNHKPNLIDKYLLVWMKKYPSVKEVPTYVTYDMMEKVRNKSRIKINIIMCVITAVVCVGMIYSGKQAAKRGESISKMNAKFHEEYNSKNS